MPSKAEQCFQILKEGIMDGTYGPGYRLVINQLAREHNISSVPWRESLRRLEAEGWVEIVPHVGAVVRTFDTDAWQRGLSLLARIGGYATALSAPNLTRDDLATARSLNEQMGDALAAFDPAQFGRLNREFHELLTVRADDARLVEMVKTEWARLEMIRKSAFWYAPGRAEASLDEHAEILDLIESGAEPGAIEEAVKQHELNTVEAVTKHDAEISHDRTGRGHR